MLTIEKLQNIIDQQIASLSIDKEPKLLYEPIVYILEDGGKRMRPLLTLLSAAAFCDEPRRAMGAALSVEVFHNFTLLHDDIMDKASMRRSRPTVHCKWNENVAILSGDAMVILAYQILTSGSEADKIPQLLAVFNRAAKEVCEGQQYDMDFESRNDVSISEYIDMIRLKTSVLMAASLEMGAIASGASDQDCQTMYDFGVDLGIAFQIQDDLLDTYGDPATFGKQIGGDIASGKKTFLHITAMERANQEQRHEMLRTDGTAEQRYARVREIYDTLAIQQAATEAISDYFHRAMTTLNRCNVAPEKVKPLFDYAYMLLRREK